MFDESLERFVPGTPVSKFPSKLADRGLVSMVTVITDPAAPQNRMQGRVRSWKQSSFNDGMSSSWFASQGSLAVQDSAPSIQVFQGEEDIVPDSIPDSLWQSHFRQHDAELNDRKETEYLLQLYKRTSGRWPVIYDRWQTHPVYGLRGKSLESLKSKFNKVVMKLFEIDILRQKRPATTVERIQISQQLKYLPIFSMKYNEKNEFLRRLFLENSFKRNAQEFEKYIGEILKVPSMSMKKKTQQIRAGSVPGPVLASSLVPSTEADFTSSEFSRVKSVLASLGIDRSAAMSTPKLAKLFASVEKEAGTLLMMRDSLQRKKQELEILRSNGGSGGLGMRARATGSPSPVQSNNQQVNQPHAFQSISVTQQKRKR